MKDLTDVPFLDADITFCVDGSCKKDDKGVHQTAYAIVTHDQVMEARPLPSSYSTQQAEIIALFRACSLREGKKINIYTDSQYAFSTIHIFAQQWKNRGMITSTGKPISHRDLILALLENVQKPTQVAICKCTAHRKGTDPITLGNALTDKTAREATTGPQKTHILYRSPRK